jgi:hypothetical protein
MIRITELKSSERLTKKLALVTAVYVVGLGLLTSLTMPQAAGLCIPFHFVIAVLAGLFTWRIEAQRRRVLEIQAYVEAQRNLYRQRNVQGHKSMPRRAKLLVAGFAAAILSMIALIGVAVYDVQQWMHQTFVSRHRVEDRQQHMTRRD